MDKINFENLPSTNTPVSAKNLNQLQANVETALVGTVLYEDETGSTEGITLNSNVADYKTIKIHYMAGHTQQVKEFFVKDGVIKGLINEVLLADSSNHIIQIQWCEILIQDNVLSVVNYGYANYSPNSNNYVSTGVNYIKITKIVGIEE